VGNDNEEVRKMAKIYVYVFKEGDAPFNNGAVREYEVIFKSGSKVRSAHYEIATVDLFDHSLPLMVKQPYKYARKLAAMARQWFASGKKIVVFHVGDPFDPRLIYVVNPRSRAIVITAEPIDKVKVKYYPIETIENLPEEEELKFKPCKSITKAIEEAGKW